MINLFTQFNKSDWKSQKEKWTHNPENYDFCFIVGKLMHWCSMLSSGLTDILNACGWQFKKGSEDHEWYIDHRDYSEIWHLLSWIRKDCYDKKLVAEDVDSVVELLDFFEQVFERHTYPKLSPEDIESVKIQCIKMRRSLRGIITTINNLQCEQMICRYSGKPCVYDDFADICTSHCSQITTKEIERQKYETGQSK